jgi:RHS repeat-associated protein
MVDYRGIFRQKNFTGKEADPETGLYYYGARYLDPKTSRWISGDPALGEYLPVAPLGDEEKKRNQNLPGQGGVFNYVNLHVYHYAGNNPVKYVDPDGRNDEPKVSGLEDALRIMGERNIEINLYPPNDLEDPLYGLVRTVPHPPGTFVVAGHGNPYLISDDRNGSDQYMDMFPTELADMIRKHIKYNPRDTIVLLSCQAGGDPDPSITKDHSFAQMLANALGPGTVVKALKHDFAMYRYKPGQFYFPDETGNYNVPQRNYDNFTIFIGR